jgi:hypothetical protein
MVSRLPDGHHSIDSDRTQCEECHVGLEKSRFGVMEVATKGKVCIYVTDYHSMCVLH